MKVLCIPLLFLLSSPLFAQDQEILRIRTIYTEVARQIEECTSPMDCSLYKNTLRINEMGSDWRAVGNYSKTITFWYTDDFANCDDCGLAGEDVLRKISIEEVSGMATYHYEYLFDQGQLIFHYYASDEEALRYYFNGEDLIRYMEGQEILDQSHASMTGEVRSESKRLLDLFLSSY